MERKEFGTIRKQLGKTQKQLAVLLGISLKAIHSYEQGWRTIPAHIERQLYFLLINQQKNGKRLIPCWIVKNCTRKEWCPAWEFQSGHLCWFLCGTLGTDTGKHVHEEIRPLSYKEKRERCGSCQIFGKLIK
ncbi:MAG: transcriptional regulator [Desulfobacterales bacterium]|nr:MAG: transcriptional regulator [Desulfobacterales bacterium]